MMTNFIYISLLVFFAGICIFIATANASLDRYPTPSSAERVNIYENDKIICAWIEGHSSIAIDCVPRVCN